MKTQFMQVWAGLRETSERGEDSSGLTTGSPVATISGNAIEGQEKEVITELERAVGARGFNRM